MNKKVIVWILLCLTFLGVSGTDIYVPALPQIVKEFHTTKAFANSTIMFFTLGMAVSVLFTGVLSNYLGRKKVLDGSVLLFGFTALLIIFSPNIQTMMVLRFIQGSACGGIIVVQRLILKDIMTEQEQVYASGMLATGAILSPAIAPSIGALIMKTWSWHVCFLFSAILGGTLVVLSNLYIAETNTNKISSFPRIKNLLSTYVEILQHRMCWSLILILSCSYASYFSFIGASSYLYINLLKFSPINYSYIFMFLAGGYFAGNTYMMHRSKHGLDAVALIKKGVVLNLVGCLMLLGTLFFTTPKVIAIILTLSIICMRFAAAFLINPVQIKITNYFKEHGAVALGAAICIEFALSGIAATVVGVFPLENLLAGLIVLSLAFAILIVWGILVVTNTEKNLSLE